VSDGRRGLDLWRFLLMPLKMEKKAIRDGGEGKTGMCERANGAFLLKRMSYR
jgi:hypothetical protein